MADIGAVINAKLLATAGVSALCGTRGYPDVLKQADVLPAYVYLTVSDVPAYHLLGESNFAEARVQINCFAVTRKDCDALARAIRTAISGQQFEQGGTYVRECHIANAFATQEQPIDGNGTWRYGRITDFLIQYI